MHVLRTDLCILGLIWDLNHSNLNLRHERLTSKDSPFFGTPCGMILLYGGYKKGNS